MQVDFHLLDIKTGAEESAWLRPALVLDVPQTVKDKLEAGNLCCSNRCCSCCICPNAASGCVNRKLSACTVPTQLLPLLRTVDLFFFCLNPKQLACAMATQVLPRCCMCSKHCFCALKQKQSVCAGATQVLLQCTDLPFASSASAFVDYKKSAEAAV